jgi:hypothetical protein
MRDPRASPPARPAAAAVPAIAGTLAFWAAVPTESPTFETVDPTELPTPVRVPATPLLDCLDRELRVLPLREGARFGAVLLAEVVLLLEVLFAVLRLPAEEP